MMLLSYTLQLLNKAAMKYLVFIFLFATSVYAEPFLVCDPQEGVTQYKIVWGEVVEYVSANPDGSFRYDVAGVPEGNSDGDLYAGKPWLINGIPQETINWSDPRPFVLTRPSAFPIPTGVRLIK